MDRGRIQAFASIPARASRVLYIVLYCLVFLGIRVWYLTSVRHDQAVATTTRARRTTVVEPALRGTIRDRFSCILAANKLSYRVGVAWGPIKDIPRTVKGKPCRRLYVQALTKRLSLELGISAERIEDLIYSYAVFGSQVTIASNIPEKTYYRLALLSKDFPGLVVERVAQRVYPRGRSCSHIVGYTAPVNGREFYRLMAEKKYIKEYVDRVERGEKEDPPEGFSSFFAAKAHALALDRKAYTINDFIGKTGIEASCEKLLRGFHGKRVFLTNAQGDFLKELSGGQRSSSGKRVILTISAELQEWCERLLAQHEQDRKILDVSGVKVPLVRGGAIVVMNPKTAEILACASFPRFDQNDFVENSPQKSRWLENEEYIGNIVYGIWPYITEQVSATGKWTEKLSWITWDMFLSYVLPTNSPLLPALQGSTPLQEVVSPQLSFAHHPHLSEQDKAIFWDFARLIIRQDEVPDKVTQALRLTSIESYMAMTAVTTQSKKYMRKVLRRPFEEGPFAAWRLEHGKAFLQQKRIEEGKRVAKPYVYYLDKECDRQYKAWWDSLGEVCLLDLLLGRPCQDLWVPPDTLQSFLPELRQQQALKELLHWLRMFDQVTSVQWLSSMKDFSEIHFPLYGTYSSSLRTNKPTSIQGVCSSFLSLQAPAMVSLAFMHPTPQGSIFKLIVALEALRQHPDSGSKFFSMYDQTFMHTGKWFVGKDENGQPIPQLYKGGRLPRSADKHIGQVDLIQAIARSSNPYFALVAAEHLQDPCDMIRAAKECGLGQKTGIVLPYEASGHLPTDLHGNTTGVYTTAIGQHTMLVTPLQTAVMLSSLMTKEVVVPRIVKMVVGPDISLHKGISSWPHKKIMSAIGIDFPLWIKDMEHISHTTIHATTKRVIRSVPMAESEQKCLCEGMNAAISRLFVDSSLRAMTRPDMWKRFSDCQGRMIGKSSTAESFERLGLGLGQKPHMYNHTWFGGVFSSTDRASGVHIFTIPDPEIVVVVFSRYGTYGKEAAPIAASVATKWKEIQAAHQSSRLMALE